MSPSPHIHHLHPCAHTQTQHIDSTLMTYNRGATRRIHLLGNQKRAARNNIATTLQPQHHQPRRVLLFVCCLLSGCMQKIVVEKNSLHLGCLKNSDCIHTHAHQTNTHTHMCSTSKQALTKAHSMRTHIPPRNTNAAAEATLISHAQVGLCFLKKTQHPSFRQPVSPKPQQPLTTLTPGCSSLQRDKNRKSIV